MKHPRVQIILDGTDIKPAVRSALAELKATTVICGLDHNFPTNDGSDLPTYDARLVLTHDIRALTNGRLGRLVELLDQNPCSTLIVSDPPRASVVDDAHSYSILARPGVDIAIGLSASELIARLARLALTHRPEAMLASPPSTNRSVQGRSVQDLQRELAELRAHDTALMASMQQMQNELQLAGHLQNDLMTAATPDIAGADLQILHRPLAPVSGDVFRVVRLDDRRVAWGLADATGHGIPAALLTMFVQRILGARFLPGVDSKSLQPSDVLSAINGELMQAGLRECHFISAVHAVYEEDTRRITIARAGAPLPIWLRRNRPWAPVLTQGPLLGVSKEAWFEPVTLQLTPGDVLLFHTDGLDPFLSDDENPLRSSWFDAWTRLPSSQVMQELERVVKRAAPPPGESAAAHRLSDFESPALTDDVTLMALTIR